ncbi:hypothetical protein AC482_06020 [miscellaneous Crenarchaeota group-15 archaeon DG-45]|uniref:Uncharacterized protein n=1 Tax=miscellaneous Crenarchaeota group-15 archaeon DG-45 TaxID=1685127 RepID=A0A0M0BM16_9ARCH|nr:MAG: hypothetical protein AC482_06020 [miscellaneous Crenarchaeota group-15 archaeon DG-45]
MCLDGITAYHPGAPPHVLVNVLGVVPLVSDDYEARPRAGLLQDRFEVDDIVPGDPPRLEAADQPQPRLHGEDALDVPRLMARGCQTTSIMFQPVSATISLTGRARRRPLKAIGLSSPLSTS